MKEPSQTPARDAPGLAPRTARILRRLLPWILVLAAPAALFHLIGRHQVNIPFLDDWMFVGMFEKDRHGFLWTLSKDEIHLTLHDFFMVQMEHRMAFVRLVILLLHKIWPAQYTTWMWFGWVLLVLTYANIGVLLRRTTGAPFRAWWPLLALAGFVVFSPVQYRVVLWAMMFQVACPGFFLSLALVSVTSPWPLWLRWGVGVLSASCATQTFASGLLVWALPLPLVLWGGTIPLRRNRWIFAGAWLAVAIATALLYFHKLENETEGPFAYKQALGEDSLRQDTWSFFAQPQRSLPYVLRFLGSHLARGTSFGLMEAALLLGSLSAAGLLAAAIYTGVHWRREDLRRRLLPWLLFGAYSPATGALVAMGRLWASKSGDSAVAARYVIHAVPLTVSLIALAWIVGRDFRQRRAGPAPAWSIGVPSVATALFAGLLLLAWRHGERLMGVWESARLRGAANTLFFNRIYQVDDIVPANRNYARRADALGLLDPPMVRDLRLDQFERATERLGASSAAWSDLALETAKGDVFGVVRGHAALPGRRRVADAILLCKRPAGSGEPWTIFHVAQVTAMPLYLAETLSRDLQFVHTPGDPQKDALSAFTGRFHVAQQLGEGVFETSAWALDYRRRLAHPMAGSFTIDTASGRITRAGDIPGGAAEKDSARPPG